MRVVLYAGTIFASALLLFVVQPLAGKELLPRLGGVPGAWTACLLFFQAALLAGYGYVWAGARLPERARAIVHVLLLAAAALALPAFSMNEIPLSPIDTPALYALAFLAVAVGAPFVLLSTTSPLLQHWLARTGARPYALYAASNAGSLGALVLYPFVIEPRSTLPVQQSIFRYGFVGVAVAIALCAIPVLRAGGAAERAVAPAPLGWARRLRWVGLALAPSMLLAGATNHLSLDLAPLPLLWVVPLALYLLSFVLAFASRVPAPPSWLARAACLVAVVLVFVVVAHANEPVWVLASLHVAFLLIASWIAHRRLADDAPDPAHLPEFYAWLAAGGVLGTLISAVLAPLVLPDLWEYPAAIALVTMARPIAGVVREDGPWKRDLAHALIVGAVTIGLAFVVPLFDDAGDLALIVTFAPGILYAYRWMPLRRRFALCILALIVGGAFVQDRGERRLTARSFFGVLRVVDEGEERHLLHGTTLHGSQRRGERDRCVPMTYYAEPGPLGSFFEAERAREATGRTVAIGLGTGAVACYSVPQENWRILEINPDVRRIAGDPAWFTFLHNAEGRVHVDLADGRLGVEGERDGSIERIVVDAFNSDSVPAHLLTREALRLYVRKLRPHGRVAIHLSNRVLDLERVLGDVVTAEGLAARLSAPNDIASWAIVARSENDLADLNTRDWPVLPRGEPSRAWTDDFSSLLSAIRALD